MRDYYEQLYTNKLDNLEEMDTFLEYSLSRLNHEETENPNRPITSKKIETVIKNFSKNKSPGPALHCYTGEFHQTLKEDLIHILLKLFKKFEEEEMFPNSLFEATITLITGC